MSISNLNSILKQAELKLVKNNISNAKKELEWFVENQFLIQKKKIFFQNNINLNNKQIKELNNFINKRISGEPFQYILKQAPFFGYDLYVNKNVFIPRPETELIINILINAKKEYKTAIDLCTGSGNLALMLSIFNIAQKITALDISKKALNIANQNFQKLQKKNISILQTDILKHCLDQTYDLIVCNPPYISLQEFINLDNEIKNFEPRIALTDEKDGFTFYHKLCKMIKNILNPKGTMLIEIGLEKHKLEIENIFKDFKYIWHKDLNHNYRVIQIFK